MIKEAEIHCTAQAHDLELSHIGSVLKLECEALMEEGHDCQVFMEACITALWACPTKNHGALMYPLLLLTDNVSLAAMLASTPQLTTMDRELLVAASPSTVSRMPTSPSGTKQQCPSSDQDATTSRAEKEEAAGLDVSQGGHPPRNGNREGPLQNSSKIAIGRPFPRTLRFSRQLGEPIIHPTKACSPKRGHMTCHWFSGKWSRKQTS